MPSRPLLELELDSELHRVAEACQAWERVASELGLSEAALGAVELALSEAINNAIIHAYSRQPGRVVRVVVRRRGAWLVIEVVDYGEPMGPERLVAARLPDRHPAEESGRGLGIICSLMWDVRYRSGPPANTLEMQYPLAGE